MLPMTQTPIGIKIVPRTERASDVAYVRPQSTARMHLPSVDMEAGCSDDDDNAYSDNGNCSSWSSMIPGELCVDEACIGTCYDDIVGIMNSPGGINNHAVIYTGPIRLC